MRFVTLDLHRLWIFLHVIDHHSFSAAAQKLFMSQPSVSNQMRRLEESLHITLIDRSGARIRPTAEGELLAEYARRVFLLADEAVSAVQQLSGLQSGRLVVGGSTTLGTYLLPDLLAEYRRRHPGIESHVFVGNNATVTQHLTSGEVGVAVVAGTPAEPRLVSEPVLEDHMVLIAPAGHPLGGREPLTGQMLSGEQIVLREPGSQTREVQERTLAGWGIVDPPHTDAWGPEVLKRCVRAGLGIALISEHAVADELRAGTLVALPTQEPAQSRVISLVRRRDRILSPAENAFVELVREQTSWPGL
ncbi:LysR family transcriptional regulator [Streptomyces poriferorum]|uniref:LysR family transcriptional regulator n=1 Tax=Streptomyces poriferorum TaxID=2798799 RepID=UPI00273E4DA8|nr:LysR family transcriptional regulator [Streptomyces sp. Alt1]WLQ52724.1 LysR family transcriptional regulator [Streptomyces sp. Alt1]